MRKFETLKHKIEHYYKQKNFITCLFLIFTVSVSGFILPFPQALAKGTGSRTIQTKQVSPARPKARTPMRTKKRTNQVQMRTLPGVTYDDITVSAKKGAGNRQSAVITSASVGNFARGLPKGLQIAHKGVQTACLNPRLVALLTTIQSHYKRPVIITSGYRSPAHNYRVRGAKHSLHMSCAAADIKISGVHKSELARFVRSLPNRGGVGTYCNQIIHVDVGARRDWNWGCGKKR